MLFYILKRVLFFIPTFFIIALVTFALSTMAPGDPVDLKLSAGMRGSEGSGQAADKLAGEEAYREITEKLGRDLPTFYFSITSKAYPDTLYKILRKPERENLERLTDQYGNWPKVNDYYKAAKQLENNAISLQIDERDSTAFNRVKAVRENCNDLFRRYDEGAIAVSMQQIKTAIDTKVQVQDDSTGPVSSYQSLAPLSDDADKLFTAYANMKSEAISSARYVPTVHLYGLRNQFHRWLFGDVPWFGKNDDPTRSSKGFLRGDFGDSYLDNRPVSSILADAIKWTLLINLIVFLIIYSVGIPAGVALAKNKGKLFDRVLSSVLFIQYSLPVAWIGTMLIIFFTSNYYAEWMDLFPPYGLGKIGPEYGFWEKVSDRAYHLILPVFCSVIGSFAYISMQMRGGMMTVLRQDYIRTAFAKGLAPNTIYWKHALRNSLIPIITIFSSFLPAMIGGSVIIEFLFTIPGMGRISYESVGARNFPVLFTILMFSAILTMLGTLVSDILYAVTDPRISFTKKEG